MIGPWSGSGGHARRRPHRLRGRVLLVGAVVLSVVGITLVGLARADASSPDLGQAVRVPERIAGAHTPDSARSPRSPEGPVLDRAVPVGLRIRTIHVRARLVQLGLNPDGTVETPDPVGTAGWYKYTPTPGEVGPAVLLGHADSGALGPGVFARLGELARGDQVEVLRADGTVAVFRVDRVGRYPMERFPVDRVYRHLDHAGIRLITCGAAADSEHIVVYGSLVSSHPLR